MIREVVKNSDGSVSKVVLENGSVIEFSDKPRNPYQSRTIEDDWWLADDVDCERLIEEAKARKVLVANVIYLDYKEERK